MMLRPPVHRGMMELDRAAFQLTFKVHAIVVPTRSIGQAKAELASDILKLAKLRNVVDGDDAASKDLKKVLLKPEITSDALAEGSERLRALVKEKEWAVTTHEVTVGYEHWTADEILKAVLPDPTQAPTSYEQVGHIAHMNLRDQYLPYRNLIGQVILDKSPVITTVVNKLDTIDNTYRNFKMEVIAGKDDFMAQVRENDCVFKFDFSKVYWNSRLHTEHERLIKQFSAGDAICDVMAGVGPFAVPAAKRDCLVWANDLNPASFAAMEQNIPLNKVQKRMRAFNMDGRDFVRKAFGDFYAATANGPLEVPQIQRSHVPRGKAKEPNAPVTPLRTKSRTFDHVVMNLPAIAIEFLDAFRGLFRSVTGNDEGSADDKAVPMPVIHAHCFTKQLDEPERDILQRACRAMGYPQEQYKQLDANVHYVRRVAPNKDMYCLSVRLPKSVAYAADNEGEESTAVSAKRKPEDATDLEENDAKCPKAE